MSRYLYYAVALPIPKKITILPIAEFNVRLLSIVHPPKRKTNTYISSFGVFGHESISILFFNVVAAHFPNRTATMPSEAWPPVPIDEE